MTVVSDYTAILSASSWNAPASGAQPVVLTYSFSSQATGWVTANHPAAVSSFQAFSAAARDAARAALRQWSEVTGIQFLETTAAEGDITFGAYDLAQLGAAGSAGLANFPTPGVFVDSGGALAVYSGTFTAAGDVHIDTATATGASVADLTHVLLHEIGHALGLKHPFDGATTLDATLDNGNQTVMAYNAPTPDVLGPLDIQAAQALYGAPGSTTTDMSWSWDAAREVFTAWGAGDGRFLRGPGAVGDVIYTMGGVNDAVVTAQGNDLIFANGQAFTANTGDGADTIVTGLRYSTLLSGVGGSGAFHYIFLPGNIFQTFYNVETLNFLDGVYDVASATFTAAPVLSVAPLDTSLAEGTGGTTGFRFTITRGGNTASAVTAAWTAIGAGASPATAADFTTASGSVSFAAGVTSVIVTVAVAADGLAEANEGFTLSLSNLTGGAILGTAGGIATIADDDGPRPVLSIAATDATRAEGNTGTTPFTFTVTRAGATATAAAARWVVAGTGANAASAADFDADALPTGTISFAAGETTKTITVMVGGDVTKEADETFSVTLLPIDDTTQIATATATGTITNDDGGRLSGQAYDWKGHALLGDVGVVATGSGHPAGQGTALLEFRNVGLNAAGALVADVWGNGGAGATAATVTLDMPLGASAVFAPDGAGLGSQSWNTTISAASFSVSTTWDTPLGASGKIGRITITLPAGATALNTVMSSGSLGGVAAAPLALSYAATTTGSGGTYDTGAIAADQYAVTVARTTADLTRAITAADALAALKLGVGTNPNPDPDGAGPLSALAVSPYQLIAADVTGDGKVTSADALSILRMAARLPSAKTPSWLLLDESMTFITAPGGAFTVSRTAVPAVGSTLSETVAGDTTTNLVGVVRGDVNGSWRPLDATGAIVPTGSYAVVAPSYFDALSQSTGAPTALWGL